MAILNFKEIPPANTSNGEQDSFEMFARDFIQDVLRLKILSQPNRGADGGKDIIAEEVLSGTVSDSTVRWLISCKHYAHSGKSVNESDEQNITDRIKQHDADGFMGIYSTIPSSGLGNRLDSIAKTYKIRTFDGKEIENQILKSGNVLLIERYFPISYKNMKSHAKTVSLLTGKYIPLPCECCGKDLLQKGANGIVVFAENLSTEEIVDVVAVCRGNCDYRMEQIFYRRDGCITSWEAIEDFTIPTIYLRKYMAIINSLFYKNTISHFTENSIEKYKKILIALSQLVLRDNTDVEWGRAQDLALIPEGL